MQDPAVDGSAFSGNCDIDCAFLFISRDLGRAQHRRVYGQQIYVNEHA